jgi:flagellar protein FliO/FliZ
MQQGLSSLLWFAAIIAAIPLVLWLLKRSPLGGAAFGHGARPGAPRFIATLPLTAQQRLVTVEVGQGEDRLWLVLGVSPQGIRTLHTMAAQPDPMADAAGLPPPAATFAQLLQRLRQGIGGGESST